MKAFFVKYNKEMKLDYGYGNGNITGNRRFCHAELERNIR